MLCRYMYYPVLVDLSEEEAEQYWSLTLKISRAMVMRDEADGRKMPEELKALLMKRARLLGSAKSKLPALANALRSLTNPLSRAIVYCGDGRVESEEREEILGLLRDGTIDAAVAIRCLDEGIDIPEVRMGFILASSTNPRQFILRRGRLLRKAHGKSRAEIWDFIVRPPDFGGQMDDGAFNIERRLFLRELLRIVDFCRTADNGDAALNTLAELRHHYNVMDVAAA